MAREGSSAVSFGSHRFGANGPKKSSGSPLPHFGAFEAPHAGTDLLKPHAISPVMLGLDPGKNCADMSPGRCSQRGRVCGQVQHPTAVFDRVGQSPGAAGSCRGREAGSLPPGSRRQSEAWTARLCPSVQRFLTRGSHRLVYCYLMNISAHYPSGCMEWSDRRRGSSCRRLGSLSKVRERLSERSGRVGDRGAARAPRARAGSVAVRFGAGRLGKRLPSRRPTFTACGLHRGCPTH